MEAKLIAILILLPVTAVFIYAGIHEYRRYKSDGKANYGLAFDEETGTTYVTDIAEDEDAFDPDDFDPGAYEERKNQSETDEDKT